jgi:hypothetical protein
VPWCEDCARFYNPNTLTEDGASPEGHHVADPVNDPDQAQKIPWHFWLLLAALVIYLGWRLIQGIAWVVGKL